MNNDSQLHGNIRPCVEANVQKIIEEKLKELSEVSPNISIEVKVMPITKFTLQKVLNWWCYYFQVSTGPVLGESRRRALINPRHGAMSMLYAESGSTIKQIGKFFGGRHHATVLHAHYNACNIMDTEPSYKEIYGKIKQHIDNDINILEYIKENS